MLLRKKTTDRLMKALNVMILGVFLLQPVGGPGLYYAFAEGDSDTDATVVQEEDDKSNEDEIAEDDESGEDEESVTDEVEESEEESVEEEESTEEDKVEETDDADTTESEESDDTDTEDDSDTEEIIDAVESDNTDTNEDEVVTDVDADTDIDTEGDNSTGENTDANNENNDTNTDEESDSGEDDVDTKDADVEESDEQKDDDVEEIIVDENKCVDKWVEKKGAYTRCVEEDIEYELDLDKNDNLDGLKIMFTDIDMDANTDNAREITVKEVKLTNEQIVELNAINNVAWEITSTMKNGTFEFELTFPSLNKSIAKDRVGVMYVEDEKDLNNKDKIKKVDKEDININKGEIKVEKLDHFTVFLIQAYSDDNFTISKSQYEQGESVYIKATGLFVSRWYRIDMYEPNGTKHNIINCSRNNTEFGIKYDLENNALTGSTWQAEITKYTTKGSCTNGQDILDKTSVQFEVTETINTRCIENTGKITIEKTAVGGDGEFEFEATNGINPFSIPIVNNGYIKMASHTIDNLVVGEYAFTEKAMSGWKLTDIECRGIDQERINYDNEDSGTVVINLMPGDDVICNYVNIQNSSLIVVKKVMNDDGGVATVDDFDITLDSELIDNFDAGTTVGDVTTYTATIDIDYCASCPQILSEKDITGYVEGRWDCGMVFDNGLSTELGFFMPGETKICTIINDDVPSKLTLKKKVITDNGGIAQNTDWILSAQSEDGSVSISGVTGDASITNANVSAGLYNLFENGPSGYEASVWDCGSTRVVDGEIEIANGDDVTCEIINDDIPSDLTVCKFNDYAGDGQYDGNEMLLGGWEMTLRNSAGDIIDQKITQNMNGCVVTPGCVTFRNLSAGNYTVTENQQDGWINTNTTNLTQPVTLDLDDNQTIYFGNQQLGTIIVHKDVVGFRGTDIIDTTNNFTVTLNGADAKILTDGETVTYNGLVVGDNLYTVDEINIPVGYVLERITPDSDTNIPGAQVMVVPGEITEVTVVNKKTSGDLQVCKFEDFNSDGVKNINEEYIEWAVGVEGQGSASRDNDGCYTWSELPMGDYTVFEVEEDGWMMTTDNNYSTVTVESGEKALIEFGNYKLGQIRAIKYEDKNDNSNYDTGESLLNGWEMTLTNVNNDSVVGTTGDDGEGVILFDNLPIGEYEVCETMQSGWTSTEPSDGSLCHTVDVSVGSEYETYFGNYQLGSITIEKQTVPNGSSQEFEFRGILSGAIKDGETIEADIVLGQFTAIETKMEGWDLTNIECDDNNSVGNIDTGVVTFNVEAGEDVKCIFTNSERPTLTLKKVVISDDGGRATQDNFQAQINANNVLWSEVVELEPGIHVANEYALTGGEGYLASVWSDDCADDGTVILDYGEHKVCTITNDDKPSKLSGFKWNDLDHNGLWDVGEESIAGVTINITDDDIFSGQTVTDAIGYYEFVVDAYKTYTISEDINSIGGNWSQTYPLNGENHVIEINILGADKSHINFGNVERGSIYGKKWHDRNMNEVRDGSEEFLSGWTIFLDENGDGMLDGNEQSTVTSTESGHVGEYLFDNIYLGEYRVCEVLQAGWQQTYPLDPNCHTVILSGDEDDCDCSDDCGISWNNNWWDCDYDCSCECDCEYDEYNFGNVQLGEVVVTKWNDINGDGVFDDDEETLNDWEMTLETDDLLYEQTQITSGDGTTTFTNLKPTLNESYELSEDLQGGWEQTNIYCGEPEEYDDILEPMTWESVFEMEPIQNDSIQFGLVAGEVKRCYIGNKVMDVDLILTKTNNEYANGPDNPGDLVKYTLTVQADMEGGPVIDAIVTDLPPEQFEYVPGSYTAVSDMNPSLTISEPTYHSPGTWTLGDMLPGEIITLAYDARIGDGAQTGVYPDIAFAEGEDVVGTGIVASSAESGFVVAQGIVNDTFVGTQIEIETEMKNPVPVEVEVDEDIETIEKKKDVYVSSTLPATGAEEGWIKFAIGILFVGMILLLGGGLVRMRHTRMLHNMKIAIFFIGLGVVFTGAGSVLAAASDLVVRADEPVEISNTTFSFGYVALDILSRNVNVECLVKKPSSSTFETFKTVTYSGTGNSGDCGINNDILSEQGVYELKVYATAGGDASESEVYEVMYNTTTPGKPKWIEKDKEGDCRYDVEFKTADDGQTTYVELYHSRDREFVADENSRFAIVVVGSNEKKTVTDNLDETSVCNKKHWYAVRAFDEAGNASKVRVEEEEIEETETVENIIVVGETTATSTTTSSTSDTGSSDEGNEIGEDGNTDTKLEGGEATEIDTNTQIDEVDGGGEVAGEATEGSFWNKMDGKWFGPLLIALGIIGIVYMVRANANGNSGNQNS